MSETTFLNASEKLILNRSKSHEVVNLCSVWLRQSVAERGADYEFRLSARNSVDYGQTATKALRTPDGRKFLFVFAVVIVGLALVHL